MTKILIIGETCIDEYIFGTCKRVCPEAAALCFSRSPIEPKTNLGMASNVLNNLKSIAPNLLLDIITNNNDNPIIKRRFVDIKYNTIIFREDINDNCLSISNNLINTNNYDIIVISDYNKGFLSYENYKTIKEIYPKAMIFADTKKTIDTRIIPYVNVIKINYFEYLSNVKNIDSFPSSSILIVTTGSEGCFIKMNNETTYFKVKPIEVRDVCGAGDTFLAGLVAEYARTKNIYESINFANKVAGEVVKKFGVSTP